MRQVIPAHSQMGRVFCALFPALERRAVFLSTFSLHETVLIIGASARVGAAFAARLRGARRCGQPRLSRSVDGFNITVRQSVWIAHHRLWAGRSTWCWSRPVALRKRRCPKGRINPISRRAMDDQFRAERRAPRWCCAMRATCAARQGVRCLPCSRQRVGRCGQPDRRAGSAIAAQARLTRFRAHRRD